MKISEYSLWHSKNFSLLAVKFCPACTEPSITWCRVSSARYLTEIKWDGKLKTNLHDPSFWDMKAEKVWRISLFNQVSCESKLTSPSDAALSSIELMPKKVRHHDTAWSWQRRFAEHWAGAHAQTLAYPGHAQANSDLIGLAQSELELPRQISRSSEFHQVKSPKFLKKDPLAMREVSTRHKVKKGAVVLKDKRNCGKVQDWQSQKSLCAKMNQRKMKIEI